MRYLRWTVFAVFFLCVACSGGQDGTEIIPDAGPKVQQGPDSPTGPMTKPPVVEDQFFDKDQDGVPDGVDNCPDDVNADQGDVDEDGIGNICDGDFDKFGDTDADGVVDEKDNCSDLASNDQTDSDGDGMGDACDDDDDNDGNIDESDNCPKVFSDSQLDSDGDGIGDACDGDMDNDGLDNGYEGALGTDPLKEDTDGDGWNDAEDNCPTIAQPTQADSDNDGIGTVCDSDNDNDGVFNQVDNCPFDFNPGQENMDSDNKGSVCDDDEDQDGDGVLDAQDNCPTVPNPGQGVNDCDIYQGENESPAQGNFLSGNALKLSGAKTKIPNFTWDQGTNTQEANACDANGHQISSPIIYDPYSDYIKIFSFYHQALLAGNHNAFFKGMELSFPTEEGTFNYKWKGTPQAFCNPYPKPGEHPIQLIANVELVKSDGKKEARFVHIVSYDGWKEKATVYFKAPFALANPKAIFNPARKCMDVFGLFNPGQNAEDWNKYQYAASLSLCQGKWSTKTLFNTQERFRPDSVFALFYNTADKKMYLIGRTEKDRMGVFAMGPGDSQVDQVVWGKRILSNLVVPQMWFGGWNLDHFYFLAKAKTENQFLIFQKPFGLGEAWNLSSMKGELVGKPSLIIQGKAPKIFNVQSNYRFYEHLLGTHFGNQKLICDKDFPPLIEEPLSMVLPNGDIYLFGMGKNVDSNGSSFFLERFRYMTANSKWSCDPLGVNLGSPIGLNLSGDSLQKSAPSFTSLDGKLDINEKIGPVGGYEDIKPSPPSSCFAGHVAVGAKMGAGADLDFLQLICAPIVQTFPYFEKDLSYSMTKLGNADYPSQDYICPSDYGYQGVMIGLRGAVQEGDAPHVVDQAQVICGHLVPDHILFDEKDPQYFLDCVGGGTLDKMFCDQQVLSGGSQSGGDTIYDFFELKTQIKSIISGLGGSTTVINGTGRVKTIELYYEPYPASIAPN